LDVAVTHTDHSVYDDYFFFGGGRKKEERNKEIEWTIRGHFVPLTKRSI
jgi:hypothetical protein